ncbi:hypothetical protein, partial [Actinomyces sp. ICM47]|uniref:hypothetical protein n=1 Tax=Actinomyces sp. ICM47 TaxID=936548 RepID=UPI0025C70587
ARLQPRHDRRAILNTQHPTTPHDQPPNSITATRKLLTPYDTAVAYDLGHVSDRERIFMRSVTQMTLLWECDLMQVK